jgi:hypothetical protein
VAWLRRLPAGRQEPGFDDEATTYPLEIREGGVFIGVDDDDAHEETV